jgi:glycosyltransferase involved in cell wall biosynthesis
VRVALIGPVPPGLGGLTPGGVATHQVHLAEGLALAGIEAPLLATNTSVEVGCWRLPNGQLPYVMRRMLQPRSWNTRTLEAFGGAGNVVRYALRISPTRRYGPRREVLRNALLYRRFLVEVRPDVVHVQHPLDRCVYARLVRRLERWRLPLVVTAHSLFGEHADRTIRQLMAPNLRAADRVIAVSEHIAEQAVELGVDSRRVHVIHSGVDTRQFQPRDRFAARQRIRIKDDARLVLFVGNLEPRKQVDVLLQAMAQVRDQIPSVQLLVVGSGESAGDQDQTRRLQQLCLDLAVRDIVRFTGRVSEEQLLDAYASADVFALPSSSEAQGIVALEAMSCGLPVVATAVGGLIGTIEHERTGYLVPPGDARALAESLARVLASSDERASVGAAARQAVMTRFAWSRTVEQTIEVYREAVACRR